MPSSPALLPLISHNASQKPSGSVQNTNMLLTVDSGAYLTTILNLVLAIGMIKIGPCCRRAPTCLASCTMWDNSRRSGGAQELLHRKMGKLYDSYYSSSIMQSSYFFAKEVLISSSIALRLLSGPLLCCHIHFRRAHVMFSN